MSLLLQAARKRVACKMIVTVPYPFNDRTRRNFGQLSRRPRPDARRRSVEHPDSARYRPRTHPLRAASHKSWHRPEHLVAPAGGAYRGGADRVADRKSVVLGKSV